MTAPADEPARAFSEDWSKCEFCDSLGLEPSGAPCPGIERRGFEAEYAR